MARMVAMARTRAHVRVCTVLLVRATIPRAKLGHISLINGALSQSFRYNPCTRGEVARTCEHAAPKQRMSSGGMGKLDDASRKARRAAYEASRRAKLKPRGPSNIIKYGGGGVVALALLSFMYNIGVGVLTEHIAEVSCNAAACPLWGLHGRCAFHPTMRRCVRFLFGLVVSEVACWGGGRVLFISSMCGRKGSKLP